MCMCLCMSVYNCRQKEQENYRNIDVFGERVRNKSTEKNWDPASNPRPSEYQSDDLTIKPLGPLTEEQKTSYIISIA